MSDNELHTGKLIKVEKISENETLTEVIIRLLGVDCELCEKEEDLFEQLKDIDDNYNKYFIFKGELYEAENIELEPYDAFCSMTFNKDGSINYITGFYNGGTCFSEMIEDELELLNKK